MTTLLLFFSIFSWAKDLPDHVYKPMIMEERYCYDLAGIFKVSDCSFGTTYNSPQTHKPCESSPQFLKVLSARTKKETGCHLQVEGVDVEGRPTNLRIFKSGGESYIVRNGVKTPALITLSFKAPRIKEFEGKKLSVREQMLSVEINHGKPDSEMILLLLLDETMTMTTNKWDGRAIGMQSIVAGVRTTPTPKPKPSPTPGPTTTPSLDQGLSQESTPTPTQTPPTGITR
ncbi:MAG: hypothetical protein IT289_06195 [Oligoflexia bacterium]|nr:hypothetical protein [Oligoflexia bacterium]